jgi:tetratricopeptide (TPR) repeat protein
MSVDGDPSPMLSPTGYELREEIGRGGMGVVYRARDARLERDVAIKFLSAQVGPDAFAVTRFRNEAKITGQLQHPGIPAVHELGALPDGKPFLAMKLVKGQTLQQLLERRENPGDELARWISIFEQVCHAVGYAHAHLVLHRDLKPSNVMVGKFGEVQVMDWGLAKTLGEAARREEPASPNDFSTIAASSAIETPEQNASATRTGSVMGTLAYMSPEQAGGETRKLDVRSDVFGLGAILCQILTGRPPYSGESANDLRLRAVRGDLSEALERLEGCGAEPELIALCKKCLAFRKEERPENGQAVANEVARIRANAEVRARAAEMERGAAEVRAFEERRRRALISAAAAAIISVFLLGIVGTSWGLVAARRSRDEEAAAKQKALDAGRKEKEARLKAQAMTKIAMDISSAMVGQWQERLRDRADTQDVRRDLLKSARDGLARFLVEARQDGDPDHLMVLSHLQLGDLELDLGNSSAAMKEFEAGHALAKRLAEQSPQSKEAQRDWMFAMNKLGDASVQMGKSQAAFEHYERGLAIAKQLGEGIGPSKEARRDLSISEKKIGDALVLLGKPKEAFNAYSRAITIDEALVADFPDDKPYRRDLGVGLERLGNAALLLGKTTQAKEYFEKSLSERRKLIETDKDDVESQRNLTISLDRLADTLLQLGQRDLAKAHYSESLAARKNLAEHDPQNNLIKRDLSISYNKLGDLAIEDGKPKDALWAYEMSRAIRDELAKRDEKNAQAQRDLAMSSSKLGDAMLLSGDGPKALEFYQKAVEIDLRLAQADSQNEVAQRDLGIGYERLGAASMQVGDIRKAVEFFEKAVAVDEARVGSPEASAQAQRDVAISYDRIGQASLLARDVTKALAYFQKALAFRERLAKADPSSAELQRELSVSYERIGAAEQARNGLVEAQSAFERCLAIREPAAQRNREDAQAQSDLFVCYLKLGETAKARHAYAKAAEWYLKAKAVVLPLQEKKLLPEALKYGAAAAEQEIEVCRHAEETLNDLEYPFEKAPEWISVLLSLRTGALLAGGKREDAVQTARRLAQWAEEREHDRDAQRFVAAQALARCAAGKEVDETILDEALGLLEKVRAAKFIKEVQVDMLRSDPAFEGVRKTTKFTELLDQIARDANQ